MRDKFSDSPLYDPTMRVGDHTLDEMIEILAGLEESLRFAIELSSEYEAEFGVGDEDIDDTGQEADDVPRAVLDDEYPSYCRAVDFIEGKYGVEIFSKIERLMQKIEDGLEVIDLYEKEISECTFPLYEHGMVDRDMFNAMTYRSGLPRDMGIEDVIGDLYRLLVFNRLSIEYYRKLAAADALGRTAVIN